MALVLAIEPNEVQADTLRHLLRARANTDVVVVGSTDAAVAAVDERVPDLVLVGALLSPRDEDPFIAYLRTLPDAGHLQTLTIPQLRQPPGAARRLGSMFSKRKTRRTDTATGGCSPTQFGDEVAAYLARACEVKAAIRQRRAAIEEAESPVADCPESAESRSSASAAGPPPQDARRFIDPGAGLESVQDGREGARHGREAGATGREAARTLAEERDQGRHAARTLAAELAAAEERHRVEITRRETEAAENRDAATRDARTAAEAQADETLAAALDRVRADAKRALAVELAEADERHRIEIARLEIEAAEQCDAAARDAQTAAEAQADETIAAGLDQVRADAERTLAGELAAAEERHRTEIARLEIEAAEQRAAAARDAQAAAETQADETLAAGLDQVRADAERTLAAELAAAEEGHRAELARLETEAVESRDVATRNAQAMAQAQADDRLTAELARVRAAAERTLVAELAAAEERHRADIAHLKSEAAKSDAAGRDAQTRAAAQADDTLTAQREYVHNGTGTLANELAAAQERHYAEIARRQAESAEPSQAAPRDVEAAAEALADDTLAAARDRVRAGAVNTLAVQLAAAEALAGERDRVRTMVERELAAEITRLETEAGSRANLTRLAARGESPAAFDRRCIPPGCVAPRSSTAGILPRRALPARYAPRGAEPRAENGCSTDVFSGDGHITGLGATRDVHHGLLGTEAGKKSEGATRDPRVVADRDPLPATAPSTSVSPTRSLEPVHRNEEAVNMNAVTDYYNLWRARFAAADAPPVKAGVARPSRVNPRRRRWALSVAAAVLVLLTNNLESGSAPRHALAVEAAGVSHATEPTRPLDQNGVRTAPIPGAMGRSDPWEPAAEDNLGTGASGRAPLGQLAMEALCILVVMLLLRLAVFVSEGFVWHALVATLALILLGFAVMRVPWGG